MRGDFSRIRFDCRRNYTAVLEQQGRVALDADANEQQFIDAYRSQRETIDAVGPYGGPADHAGFEITVDTEKNNILIGPGRYYVNGLLCENQASLSYENQPYLIDRDAASPMSELTKISEPENEGQTVMEFSLQVWQRLQTALDDPCLREPAIGRADTTARLQTVWRVVADPVAAPQPQPGTADPSPSRQGTMTASTSGPAADSGLEPIGAAGYQGIENQLYRVEIHTGGDETQATFKWSRENGSVVAAITAISGSTVTVSSLGPDANLGFQPGQWVELTDDTFEFARTPNSPGTLYQIQSVQPIDLSVTLAVPADLAIEVDPGKNARMRRWDQSGPAATATGIPLSAGSWIQLENGIQVKFSGEGTSFHSSDYWTIPARTATGQIEWPPGGSDGEPFQPPASVQVHSAPLARVVHEHHGVRVEDCRRKFSPLTDIAAPAAVEAIHVTDVSWVNDHVVTLDALARGLTITLDQAPTSPLSGANVIVTVEAYAMTGGNDGPTAYTTNLRTVTVIDTKVTLDGSKITWQLSTDQMQDLNKILLQGALAQQWAKMRIRLLGQMIYAIGAAGQLVYMDGLALGQPHVRRNGDTRIDDTRIDLRLPSGVGLVASDFEGWLYVAPILEVVMVKVIPPAVTVTGERSVLTAEITVNYPASADTTVMLSLSESDRRRWTGHGGQGGKYRRRPGHRDDP